MKRLGAISGMLISVALVGLCGQSFSPLYPPSSVQNLYAYCLYGGVIVYNCDLTINDTFYANSNGHFHNSARPSSSVSPTYGNTGSLGYVPFTLTTTITGQAESVYACAYSCGYFDYGVGYGDLSPASEIVFVWRGGNTTNHGDDTYNHWMMSDAEHDMYLACSDYVNAHGYYACLMNDMALPYGGKFDINDTWASPHFTHDRGRAADINGISSSDAAEFLQDCTNRGAVETLLHSNGSLHCRF